VPRSGDHARERLREAALDLYAQQGYENTTTAQIAARAGVTERTYFRHFADKREVLFDGETELRDVLCGAVAAAAADLPPLPVLESAFLAAVPLFVAGRPVAERRRAVIAVTPALQERALAKTSALAAALADALTARGVTAPTAALAAQLALAAFGWAVGAWAGTSAEELARAIIKSGQEVRVLTAGHSAPPTRVRSRPAAQP
jgi:AcrR family transcriptional regulator